jgi:hypothetical protein
MPTLVITRMPGSIVDGFRPYEVLVDGIDRGRVSVNGQLSVDIEPGVHSVRFRMGFYSSLPVMLHISYGETSVACRSTSRRLLGLLALFAPHTWIMTSVREHSDLPRSLSQPRAVARKRSAKDTAFGRCLPKALLPRYRLAR